MRGGGDHGKCTVEVEVDGVAEVEIRGDVGLLRTLSGRIARWRRFECNDVLPRNPVDFRFRGIDGRGRQDLVNDPRSGRGVAVVRITDNRGGSEGYTFDIEWNGGRGFGGGAVGRPPVGGGGWRGDGGSWNREFSYRGRGDGYYRDSRGGREKLFDCRVTVSSRGDVIVSFQTDRNRRMEMTGRLSRIDRDRLTASVNGYGISGAMLVVLDGNRVREISMDGAGRERFELRWRD
jgi:hypothetical protein